MTQKRHVSEERTINVTQPERTLTAAEQAMDRALEQEAIVVGAVRDAQNSATVRHTRAFERAARHITH